MIALRSDFERLTKAQYARRARKQNRIKGLLERRAQNREIAATDKLVADIGRKGRASHFGTLGAALGVAK